jgi:hypothetical protein
MPRPQDIPITERRPIYRAWRPLFPPKVTVKSRMAASRACYEVVLLVPSMSAAASRAWSITGIWLLWNLK